MKNDSREIVNYSSLSGIIVTHEGAPTSFPEHWHTAAEITAVLKDNCRYKVGGETIRANKGDIVLFWPRELHEVLSVPREGTIFVQFAPTLLEHNLDLVSIMRLMNRCHLIMSSEHPALASSIFEKILKIKEIYGSGDHLSETKCKLLTYEIVVLIGEHVIKEREAQVGADHTPDKNRAVIHAVLNYITEHSSEEISEAQVAAAVGLSPYYFSKVFRKYMQTSFPSYLAAVRVRTAISLLADESYTITECAFRAGFQSTTTFNRVFREITGYSPRDYRKLHAIG